MTIAERTTIYSVEDGLSSIRTKERYRDAFRLFLKYCQLEENATSLLDENPRRLEERIIGYVRYLDQVKHLARGTITIALCAIFHFMEMNDVLLNKRKISRFMPEAMTMHDDRAYTHQEISQILLKCDERSRVMILLMASTGMRIGALEGLQLGHLTEIPEYKLLKILVYASSPRDKYYTFCTPECKQAIDSYLAYRARFGDPLKKQAPLIREEFDIYDKLQCAYPRPVRYRGILWIITDLLRRAGFPTRGEVMRSHGFRKFAITQMIKAKVDYECREYLVGHRHSRGLDVNYDRTTEEDRLQEYLKALDLLTINQENRLKIKIHQLESQHSEEWNMLMNKIQSLEQKYNNESD